MYKGKALHAAALVTQTAMIHKEELAKTIMSPKQEEWKHQKSCKNKKYGKGTKQLFVSFKQFVLFNHLVCEIATLLLSHNTNLELRIAIICLVESGIM